MHRYLRPDNFLFVSKDEDAALKVIDFGMSVFYMPDAGDEASSLIIQKNVDFESEPWPSISDGHRWIVGDGVTPEKPLDSAVLSRLKRFSAMKKLKKMALRFIGEKMSDEETGGLKKLFKMFDTYKSGTITCDELNKGLRKLGSDLMESEVQTLMQGDGQTDYSQFASMMRKELQEMMS
ncbi:uncharacterized protein A4U43_C02F7290 [Asparagus officinalis]|uniref:EF-hand domain-containing protein n=1 Tax=Asparagus officinalis TaxID=4686 RepID=A0A5P1FGL5_ASPOF|nr:uncharacterized protein A4U43_C02F7290 [Asparagus officinalis]